MASKKDVTDILGLGVGDGTPTPKGPAPKRQKTAHAGKRLTGINRELGALYGDRVPPVSVVDAKKTYRAKLQRDGPAKKWEAAPFTSSARRDGLVLKHWKPKKTPKAANADATMENAENQDPEAKQEDYSFAKYDVQITAPEYTDEQYDEKLLDSDWSKEETDYLVGLVKEFYQKWPVIYDRYDYKPSKTEVPSSSTEGDAMESDKPSTDLVRIESQSAPKVRSIEEMKARYYQVCAAAQEFVIAGGVGGMNESEYQLHEIYKKYDARTEWHRKKIASNLLSRSLEEIKEEEHLLAELQRISIAQPRMDAERADIRNALEAHQSNPNAQQYSSSAALQHLFNTLFANERNRKRGGRPSNGEPLNSPGVGSINGTPVTAGVGGRDSFGSAGPQKRGSLVPNGAQEAVRQLTQRQELRFGVSRHDRLTNGVVFRTDKLMKMRQAKSQTQTTKIANALQELGVPELLQVPSDKVLESFEVLTKKVNELVDARKAMEKEKGDMKVLQTMDAMKAGGGEGQGAVPGSDAPTAGDGREEQSEQPEAIVDADAEAEADADENGEEDGQEDDEGDGDGDMDADADAAEAEDDMDPDQEADLEDDQEQEDDAQGEEDDAEGEQDVEDFNEEDFEAEEVPRPASSGSRASVGGRGQKRSASVLSGASSVRSNKRNRR
ncbi:hypothetical protein LTS18_000039 [Coniosporium uncinatum]|uniref:Uncharacterized protein n=1 Tax=Coniosporium uncinatum TaxID=93489 RepID=A0ACC3DDU2_9PEZI|nr:hypothetical protein LTS18_000039 [Coniosporium uncinatum]